MDCGELKIWCGVEGEGSASEGTEKADGCLGQKQRGAWAGARVTKTQAASGCPFALGHLAGLCLTKPRAGAGLPGPTPSTKTQAASA